MRKLGFLLVSLIAAGLAPLASGQADNPQIQFVTSTPSGSCAATGIRLLTPNGTFYTCQSGMWAAIGGGGGGSPVGSAGCVQLYATSSTFGSACAAGESLIGTTAVSAGLRIRGDGIGSYGGSPGMLVLDADDDTPFALVIKNETFSATKVFGMYTPSSGGGIQFTWDPAADNTSLEYDPGRKRWLFYNFGPSLAETVAIAKGYSGQTADLFDLCGVGECASNDAPFTKADANGNWYAPMLVGYRGDQASPAVATCGVIGTNSTNPAGFITSDVTGSCVSVITFTTTAPNGWSCAISNATTANLIRQTGSSPTTATFTGVTVANDILRYACIAF